MSCQILFPAKQILTDKTGSGMEILKPFDAEEYSGQFRLRMPKSLHKLLAERSKQEVISMNQYCVYLLSHYS